MTNFCWLSATWATSICISAAAGAGSQQKGGDLDAVKRWVELHAATGTLHVTLVELFESPAGRIDAWTLLERQTWSFRWPDAMHRVVLQTTVEPPLAAPFQGLAVWPEVDEARATVLESVIENDGKRVSHGPAGYTVIEGPWSLSEGSPRWFRITPWLAARFIRAIGVQNVALTREEGAIALSFTQERMQLVFEQTPGGELRLATVRELGRDGTLSRADTFSDFRTVAGLPFAVPFRRDFRMRALDVADPKDPKMPEWRSGSARYLSVTSVLETRPDLFSLPIPKSVSSNQVRVFPGQSASKPTGVGSQTSSASSWPNRLRIIAVAVVSLIVFGALMWYWRSRPGFR